MKAVVHHGSAVFTQVRQFTKLSGEDVILAHVLLKAPIKQRDHLLATGSMHALLGELDDDRRTERRTEDCGELGQVDVTVYYSSPHLAGVPSVRASFPSKLRMFSKVEWHLVKRLVTPASKRHESLSSGEVTGAGRR
jgi:hypothetical protein